MLPDFLIPPRNRKGWLACVGVVLVVTLGLNGLLAAFGWRDTGPQDYQSVALALPPGGVIGAVWTLLFVGLGTAFWLLASAPSPQTRRKSGEVLAFMAFCLAYPFLTVGFSFPVVIIGGNFLCILWSAYLTGVVRDVSRPAEGLLFLPALWVCYATWAVLT